MAHAEENSYFSDGRDTESEPESFAVKAPDRHKQGDRSTRPLSVEDEVDTHIEVENEEESNAVAANPNSLLPAELVPLANTPFINLVFLTTIVRRIPCIIIPPSPNPAASPAIFHQNQSRITYQSQLPQLPLRAILHTPKTRNNPKGIPNLTMTFLQPCYFGSCLKISKNTFKELEPAEHLGRNKRLVERGVECECGVEGCEKLQREAGKGRRYPMRKKTKGKDVVIDEGENENELANTEVVVEEYEVKRLRSGRMR